MDKTYFQKWSSRTCEYFKSPEYVRPCPGYTFQSGVRAVEDNSKLVLHYFPYSATSPNYFQYIPFPINAWTSCLSSTL